MTQRLDDLGWLVGRWTSNTDAGRSQALWTEPDGGLMLGVNLEIKSVGDTVYEFLRVEESSEGLTLCSSTNGEREIAFALRELEAERVEFQRQFPDFPSLVAYWKDGDELCAWANGALGAARRAKAGKGPAHRRPA